MALQLDPEIAAALAPMRAAMAGRTPPIAGDWKTRRHNVEGMLSLLATLAPVPADVTTRDFSTKSHDGADVTLRWFTKSGAAQPGSGVLYVHGGGMILGSVALYESIIKRYVSTSGVPMLAVDYRLAPEHPHPTPVEDCYAGLCYLHAHASELGVDPARIAIMGDSAGGGLAAATALVARDRKGPPLSRQILVYPMLDDRNVHASPELAKLAMWSYDDNITGWGALLGELHGTDGVPHSAAPARATDLSGLPPTYVEVGDLDIFRDEDIEYARRLSAASVTTELHLHPGAPHGFDELAPRSAVAQRSAADRLRVLRSL